MASIILSTAGYQLGGPLGAVLGQAIGQGVDSAFAPRRLTDLHLQSSAYGEPLPLAQGRVRVAGNLVWARRTPYRGKGDDGVSASFALLLAQGPVLRCERVWADGRLLRDADGVWAEPVTMRFHDGARGQAVDPLIAAAEGAAAPAYRGRAYAVFEDLDLGPFGNRIPNLSFELVADEVDAAGWAEQLAARACVALAANATDETLVGHVAAGPTLRDALAPLVEAAGWPMCAGETGLRLGDGTLHAVDTAELLADAEEAARVLPSRPPQGWSIGYLDPARDYQRGLQAVGHDGGASDLPLVMAAETARGLATCRLARARAGAETLSLRLPWSRLGIVPGDRLDFGGRRWRVRRREVVGLAVELACTAEPGPVAAVPDADAGRLLDMAVPPAPPTTLMLVTLPQPPEGWNSAGPWIAAGGGTGWRGAAVAAVGGGMRVEQGRVLRSAIAGVLAEPLAADVGSLLLRLDDLEAAREWRPGPGTLLYLGGEALGFTEAVAVGPGLLRLDGLSRGLFGSVAADHARGAAVALLDASLILPLDWPAAATGKMLRLLAEGAGDPPGGSPLDIVPG